MTTALRALALLGSTLSRGDSHRSRALTRRTYRQPRAWVAGMSRKPRAAVLRVARARNFRLPSPPAYYFPTHERTCSWLLHCYTMIWAVLDAPKREGSRKARMTCWLGGVGDRRPLQRWLPRHERCCRAILWPSGTRKGERLCVHDAPRCSVMQGLSPPLSSQSEVEEGCAGISV